MPSEIYMPVLSVYTHVGTKTISITEDAYERLKAHKRAGESFTAS